MGRTKRPPPTSNLLRSAEDWRGSSLAWSCCERPSEDGEYDPEEEGRALIESVVKEADIGQDYEEQVLVTDGDIRETLLDAVDEYDTICVGATRSTAVAQALFGSIPEEIGEKSKGTVALARGALYKPRSVAQGVVDVLST